MCLFLADLLPQRITPQYKEVDLGKSVTFECLSVHQSIITWIFNYGPVTGYAMKEMPSGLKLHIKSVGTIHSGKYTCVGYHFREEEIDTPAYFIAAAVLKVFGTHSVNHITNFNFKLHITFCIKSISN